MNGRTSGSPRSLGKWTPAIVAGVVFAGVIGATVAASGNDDASGADSSVTSVSALGTDDAQEPVVVTASTIPGYTTTTLAFTPLSTTLGMGSAGSEVEAVQQRLKDLHFDPGPIDGYYGDNTRSAVWAFEKLILGVPREKATGKVTPDTWAAMHQFIEIQPKRPKATATHLEVYLQQQVAVLFKDNVPELITHISTGSGEKWCEDITLDPGTDENTGTTPITKSICGTSITPGGIYSFKRRYVEGDGWRTGALGRMYKPVYFNYGVAVHGSSNVPNKPASHGCVRIPMHIAKYFPDLVKHGDQVYVFDGVHDPEFYGSPPPPFDYPNPDATTTTSTSTTAVPTTTGSGKTSTTTAGATSTTPATTTIAKTTTSAAPTTTTAPVPTTTPAPPTSAALP